MSLVEFSVDHAVGLVTLNRPPVNALNGELIADISSAIAQARDPAVRAVVVTGAPNFSVGADIKGFTASFGSSAGEPQAAELGDMVRSLEKLEKPTIAAIRGVALGGGLELAMGCDYRYLGEDAKVGQPEALLGLLPGAGGSVRLERLVGYQRAKEIMMTGRHVAADEAVAVGLADVVVPEGRVLGAALDAAAAWARGATRAFAAIKQTLIATSGLTTDEALAVERAAFNDLFATRDAREGVTAFLEKRSAEFEGR